ncbi:hypothetical protein [Streptomyces sp. NPDC002328]|uniref:hypothetical protein n=1 Tax=Streptomyces sp. NPDC002328 TaxID=3364642 RepID=UPI0036AAFFE7
MNESASDTSSTGVRRLLRVDAALSSGPGIILMIAVLMGLVFTGSPFGYGAAGVLFAAWVCVGIIGKRHQSRKSRTSDSSL